MYCYRYFSYIIKRIAKPTVTVNGQDERRTYFMLSYSCATKGTKQKPPVFDMHPKSQTLLECVYHWRVVIIIFFCNT